MSADLHTHPTASRRTFLNRAALAAAAPTAAALFGAVLAPGTARATAGGDRPRYAPIPPASLGPRLNADGYYVGRIRDNLYWITDSYYQVMFLSTSAGVVLVDAPPTIGHNLLRAIRAVTGDLGRPSRVTHLVYSHSHADHIGAAPIFGPDVVRVAHVECHRLIRESGDPNRPLPTVTFTDRYDLRVGGEHLLLRHHGPNHSPDNIFVYAPRHRTLMVVDVIYPGWVPFKNLALTQDIPGWLRAHDIAMSYPWRTLVGGHLGRLGVRADGRLQQEYLADLDASVRHTMATLDPVPLMRRYGDNAWAIFEAYLDEAATLAAAPVVAKYLGRLAAADVLTFDNAFALFESLRIDVGELGPFSIRP
jgi:glyoxylase-like metal-dependent hydrolase (beta-lactamase superfamily II)